MKNWFLIFITIFFPLSAFSQIVYPIGSKIAGWYDPDPEFNDLSIMPESHCDEYLPRIQKLLVDTKNRADTTKHSGLIIDYCSAGLVGEKHPTWVQRGEYQYSYFIAYKCDGDESVLAIFQEHISTSKRDAIFFDYDHKNQTGYISYVYAEVTKGVKVRVKFTRNEMIPILAERLATIEKIVKGK